MKNFLLPVLLWTALGLSGQVLKPSATEALVKVSAVDNNNHRLGGQLITFISSKDNKTYKGITDTAGRFSILLPPAQTYKVLYKFFDGDYGDLSLALDASTKPATYTYKIIVTPPQTFTLNDVLFDNAKSTLRPESNKELNQLADYLSLKKTLVIEIAGHTDNVGKAEANQKLSEDRANAVRQYLIKKGTAGERLIAKGYGDSQPVDDNGTAAGRQKNRRTEVRIISE